MQPILHLSIPVRELAEARMQITLQHRVDEAGAPYPGSVRHFGVTLGRDDFDALAARLAADAAPWLSPVSTDNAGTATEQTKAKFADPSGNVIEIKTFADVASALGISPHSYPDVIEHGN